MISLVSRQAIALTAAMWTAALCLILLPLLVIGGPPRPAMLLNIGSTLIIGLAASALLYRIAGRLAARSAWLRGAGLAAAVLVLAGLIALADAAKDRALMAHFEPAAPSRPVLLGASGNLILFALLLGFTAALHLVLHGHAQLQARERELAVAREAAARAELAAAQAEAAATHARLAALRYQLNPHFLFNTLNAISSMVVTGRNDAAEGMLTKLSEFLRTTLAAHPDALIALQDELASVADYLEIERFRLRDRLDFEVDCPAYLADARVPSFLLQPLIENAIKHGVAPTSRAVTISVRVRRAVGDQLRIVVADDGGGPAAVPAAAPGFGIGLANVQERLRSVYGPAATIETTRPAIGFEVAVQLPLGTRHVPDLRVA
ncbi:sensor histidine kinase [Sphingosinicella sp. BN140058]|uniref:sensor histidine kinase n=1 Tax=Sphingosinicella sp. BN140058 TaxID=1892855 RepID=UPI001010AE68|nr:histidine kinase [Sphingosinicella sp. BN140058]QAY75840.1 hypothetical protein ETR14_04305 [Sphingosinicella sp. BN140058]